MLCKVLISNLIFNLSLAIKLKMAFTFDFLKLDNSTTLFWIKLDITLSSSVLYKSRQFILEDSFISLLSQNIDKLTAILFIFKFQNLILIFQNKI